MNWKNAGKGILFPHIAVMLVLVPVAAFFLVYAMVFLERDSVPTITAYILSAYTLTVWCLKIPYLVRFFKSVKNENKYVRVWFQNARLRVNVSLYGSIIWNAAYAVFQLGLGIWHRTFWFCSLAGYYMALAWMRFFLIRHTAKYKPGQRMQEEMVKYRACGIMFLLMNLALSPIIFFMVYWDRTFTHHEITAIILAAYTFASLTMAIVNVVKYRKYNSPVYSASKAISLAAACVSMLILESTMLTTFGGATTDITFRRIMLGVTGGAVSLFIIVMAISMIIQSNKKIRKLKTAEEIFNG